VPPSAGFGAGSTVRFAARPLHGGPEDARVEVLGSDLQHVEQQALLGFEVGKEPALGEPELLRQVADAERLEPYVPGELERTLDDARPRRFPLGRDRLTLRARLHTT